LSVLDVKSQRVLMLHLTIFSFFHAQKALWWQTDELAFLYHLLDQQVKTTLYSNWC